MLSAVRQPPSCLFLLIRQQYLLHDKFIVHFTPVHKTIRTCLIKICHGSAHMRDTISESPGRYLAAIILLLFGAYWINYWSVLSFDQSPVLLGVLASIALTLSAISLRLFFRCRSVSTYSRKAQKAGSIRRQIFIVVAIEAIAIFLITRLLSNAGYSDWTMIALVLIVGLHFIPLAAVLGNKSYLWTAGALVLIGLTFPLLFSAGPAEPSIELFAGLTLWITAFHTLLTGQLSIMKR